MKSKGFSVLSIFLVLVLCTTCSKDDGFLTPEGESSALKGAKTVAKVKPSGDMSGVTDHYNISEALQNAGPGDIVQLKEGKFFLHKSLFCWDFDGTLKGSGKDKTTIQTAPGMLFDVTDCPPLHWPWGTVEGHFVICFPYSSDSEGGTVTVSDLKVHVTERSTEWLNAVGDPRDALQAINVHNESLIILGDLALSNQIDLNVNFKNISVVGEEDSNGKIIGIGLAAFGASSGNFEAKNCDLTNVYNGINPQVFCGENSVATMKNCKIENTITGSYSLLVSSYDIRGNELSNVDQIGFQLYTNNPWANFEMPENVYSSIKDNILYMNTSDLNSPAIFGVRMHNVDVYNNVIRGKCGVGITAWGGAFDNCQNWSIKDNDLCDLVLTHTNLPPGTTIELNRALNCEVKNNWNQVVGGASAGDPSNLIGEALDCE